MKVPVYSLKGTKVGSVELPPVFSTPFRPDIIHRVYVALDSHRYQPKGTDPMAGERTSAESWGVGHGVARVARVKGERHPRAGQAAGIASVVKGRVAHPPKSEKIIWKRVNKKEKRLALASAIAATANRELIILRGHKVGELKTFPIVVSDSIEKVKKAKQIIEFLEKIGLKEELKRLEKSRKKRSGKPRMRGRVTRSAQGPLIIVSQDKGIKNAVKNLIGIKCVLAKDLSVLDLAPGANVGRLTIWSKSALKSIVKPVLRIGEIVAA